MNDVDNSVNFIYTDEEKYSWIKLQINNRIKRVNLKQTDFYNLIQTIRRHFKDVDKHIFDLTHTSALIQSLDEESKQLYIMNLMKSINLNYQDDEGDEIEIDNDESLLQALRFAKTCGSGKVLKIKINLLELQHSRKYSQEILQKDQISNNVQEVYNRSDNIEENKQIAEKHQNLEDREEEVKNGSNFFYQYEEQMRQSQLLQKRELSKVEIYDPSIYVDKQEETYLGKHEESQENQIYVNPYLGQYHQQPYDNYNYSPYKPQDYQNDQNQSTGALRQTGLASAFMMPIFNPQNTTLNSQNDQLNNHLVEDKMIIGSEELSLNDGNPEQSDDVNNIIRALNNRSSVNTDELAQQQQILEQIEAYKKLKEQQKQDEEYARQISFQETIRAQQTQTQLQQQQPPQNFQQPFMFDQRQQSYGTQVSQNPYNSDMMMQPQQSPIMYRPSNQMIKPIKIVASAKLIRDEKNKRHDPSVQKVTKLWSAITTSSAKASAQDRILMSVPINGSMSSARKIDQKNDLSILQVKWDICNKSKMHWDSCNLILKDSQCQTGLKLAIDPMYIKEGTKPSRIETLDLILKYPVSLLSHKMTLIFTIQDQSNKQVGENLIAVIDQANLPLVVGSNQLQQIPIPRNQTDVNQLPRRVSQPQQNQGRVIQVNEDKLQQDAQKLMFTTNMDIELCYDILKQNNGNYDVTLKQLLQFKE
ncbi:UNKNOWN [Stylonychia lemnae]|uniref:PB1 domain-containing protein n=1 Tax=Stylonychia lemnae TaxID=5949 RepID=A0A078A3Z1_STYLE|nr:UNKNOWN [Stylonychia lemnae]|eukprot:CDW75479.1 UNKNOWN [Stylonychia lemnae]